MVDFLTKDLPEETRVIVDPHYLRLYPAFDGMMHDECMVGIGGTPLRWYSGKRDVPPQAQLHPSVIERLKLEKVRNFTSYGPYRPATLRNHPKAKEFFADEVAQPQLLPLRVGSIQYCLPDQLDGVQYLKLIQIDHVAPQDRFLGCGASY
jgi:hypothetical protein